jgi:hypothetical protein
VRGAARVRLRRLSGLTRKAMALPTETATRTEPQAGPDLDREIERLVLGIAPGDAVPPYSTDDATAAGLAARFCRERGWWRFEKKEVYGGWSVGWIEEGQPYLHSAYPVRSSAPTRALAICRSLLRVAGSIAARRRRAPHAALKRSACLRA